MAERDRPHIVVHERARRERYKPPPRVIAPTRPPPPADRVAHGIGLRNSLESAAQSAEAERLAPGITIQGAIPGIHVTFTGRKGFNLLLGSLEKRGRTRNREIQIDNVVEDGDVQRATVFVPDGQVGHFLRRFEDYATKNTARGKPKHQPLVESIAAVQLATLEAMWTDASSALPARDEQAWFEVWLRHRDDEEVARLQQYAAQMNFRVGPRTLRFDDRVVVLVHASLAQLAGSIAVLDDLAELRRAPECTAPLFDMDNVEQREWIDELLSRVSSGEPRAYVCVLDTGINGGHPLLEPFLAAADAHAVDPGWGTHDHHGHGTEMAGLALLGDLAPLLLSSAPVRVSHRLESVKILPPPGQPANDPELYGAITAEAVSRVEVTDASRPSP